MKSKPGSTLTTGARILTGESDPAVAAKVDAQIRKDWTRQTLRNAVALAKQDETFRRRLLDDLLALGKGKRGKQVPKWERMKLIDDFKIARTLLESLGRDTTDKACADFLLDYIYTSTWDPDTLLKRHSRYRKALAK